MSKIAIIYSTTDGQTKKIANVLKSNMELDHLVEMVPLTEVHNLRLQDCEKIVLGASIRYGRHKPEVLRFIQNHRKILDEKLTFFFSVNVVARKIEKSSASTNPYLQKFLAQACWTPTRAEVFAGKVDYPNYDFFARNIIRLIMVLTQGPTDTSKSYEFTNWEKVEQFSNVISATN